MSSDSLLTALAKQGGLAKSHWVSCGIDPADMNSRNYKHVFGCLAFHLNGRFKTDDVIEFAEEQGYGFNLDESDCIDLILQELNGTNVYNQYGQEQQFNLMQEEYYREDI